jgi:hypothetical protein
VVYRLVVLWVGLYRSTNNYVKALVVVPMIPSITSITVGSEKARTVRMAPRDLRGLRVVISFLLRDNLLQAGEIPNRSTLGLKSFLHHWWLEQVRTCHSWAPATLLITTLQIRIPKSSDLSLCH